VAYVLTFGVGTVAGMMLTTTAIAVPFAYTATRSPRLNHHLGMASGLLGLGFGLVLAYQIGLVDGLFPATLRWPLE